MKKLLVSLIFILCTSCFATPPSFTNVTATLTDSNGQIWTNGTWTAELIPPFGNPNKPLNNGNPITDSPQSGVMDGTGTLTVTLDDNSKIFPSGSTWKFTLCPNASVTNCSQSIQVVSGASQNLSASISADLVPIITFALPVLNRAYNDTQVNASTGALYWRVTDNIIRGRTTTGAWVTIGNIGDIFNQSNTWNGTQLFNNIVTFNAGFTGTVDSSTLSRVLFHDGTAHVHTGDTNEDTIYSMTIPANKLGINGSLRITIRISTTGMPGVGTLRVHLGGQNNLTFAGGFTVTNQNVDIIITNRGLTNSQFLSGTLQGSGGSPSIQTGSGTVDTTLAQTLTITIQDSDPGNSETFNIGIVELLP